MPCVIWFNHPRALEYLVTNGEVYTLRARLRRCPCGRVLIMSRLGFKARGSIRLIGVIDLTDPTQVGLLVKYVGGSGFNSLGEWLEAFRRLNGPAARAYLYHVVLAQAPGITRGS